MKFFGILLALSMPFIVFVQAQQVQSDEIPFEHKKELALEIINAELNIRGPQGGQIPEVVDIHPIVGGKENSEDHIRRLEALKAYILSEDVQKRLAKRGLSKKQIEEIIDYCFIRDFIFL